MGFMDSVIFTWVILPILIFISRVLDVSVGTLRIVFIAKGSKIVAPILGFFEVLIWLLAMGQIFQNLNNVLCYIAYAGGFAAGNYVGMVIEQKLAVGMLVIRIITRETATSLVESLKDGGYGVTTVDGEGTTGKVKIIFSLIKRKDLTKIIELIRKFNPRAFFSVEDVRFTQQGVFPLKAKNNKQFVRRLRERKGK